MSIQSVNEQTNSVLKNPKIHNQSSLARKSLVEEPKELKSRLKCIYKVVNLSPLWEKSLLVLGCLFATINGCCWPLVTLELAQMANFLSRVSMSHQQKIECMSANNGTNISNEIRANSRAIQYVKNSDQLPKSFLHLPSFDMPTPEEWNNTIQQFITFALATVLVLIITGFFYHLLLSAISERITIRLRKHFFKAMLRQNVAWFDARSHGELNNYMLRNMNMIQTALGIKLGMMFMCAAEITLSIIICLCRGWKLTLVLSCAYPIMLGIAHVSQHLQHKMNRNVRVFNDELTTFLQEIFSAVRTIVAFGGEEKESVRFANNLQMAKKENMKQTVISTMNFSVIFIVSQSFIAISFWYGMHLMQISETNGSGDYTPANVILNTVIVMMVGIFVYLSVPIIESVASGFSAAVDIVAVLERNPPIDSYSESGITLQKLRGNIEFNHVHFWYTHTAGEKKILNGLNLKIKAGETVALVGPSGGGKSTIMQLILRFYDPQNGKVKIDGNHLHDLNIGWLRDNIAVVDQEPSLFNTTIRENIRLGYDQATEDDIIRSAKAAYAHEFIMRLPQQYNTILGDQGGQLSGGEKQRIAIARALIHNPAILLLDEATSALDSESEIMVQNSLTKVRSGKTTLIIAHRLSTITNVDRIVSIQDGKVAQEGTHKQLIQNKTGIYYQLLQSETNEITEQVEDVKYVEDETDDYQTESSSSYVPLDSVEKESKLSKSFWKILLLSKPQWADILAAVTLSIIYAMHHPARAILFSIMAQMVVTKDYGQSYRISYISCAYVLTGVITFATYSLRGWFFSRLEENLVANIRHKAFQNLLRQDVQWFDDPQNSLANLVSLLTVECEHAKFIPGTIIGTWVYITVAVTSLISYSLWETYKLALAVGPISVCVFVTQSLQHKTAQEKLTSLQKAEARANNVAMEAMRNSKTIAALHCEKCIVKLYSNAVGNATRLSDPQLLQQTAILTSGHAIMMLGFIVAMSYGSYLIYHGELSYFGYTVIHSMLIVNMMEASQAFATSPSYNRACISAHRVRRVMEAKSLINTGPATGLRLPSTINAGIGFRNIRFAYPSRPTEDVLQGFDITIEQGQTVAFIGKSGSGKTTAFQLLQRFYDPSSGSVTLSGYDLRNLNLPWLRSIIGIVSQQPTLFNRTVAENIAYGDNSRTVGMHDIIAAARQANIHDFISTLRQGYETRLGHRGVQLSGGQKQRVAIARALIRNPKILLLDEATSSLDNASEKIVQEALEKAREGRTCLIIAHRLSTVQNADHIAVFDHGRIAEQGTPKELMDKKGLYYEYLQIQQGNRTRLTRPLFQAIPKE